MEFGSLPAGQLEHVNFKLPPDSSFNNEVLRSNLKTIKTKIYVGCGKWGRKDWVGKIFPGGTKEKDFLQHYVSQFNAIELNATYYQIYGPTTISRWAEKAAGTDFKFCPKVPQSITHNKDLVSPHVQRLTAEFIEGINAFKDNLGPVFLQLNEKFSPARRGSLYCFLKTLPASPAFFVEVRHPEWLSVQDTRTEYFQMLRELGKGAVITDVAGRRDCAHMQLPLPKAFIRFVGNHLHNTDFTRLDEWVQRIKSWSGKGLKELYFFMHHPEEKESPELCDYFIEQLNKHCKTNLKRPEFVKDVLTVED